MHDKLYIHIGFHKTGTTSVQWCLYENKNILWKKGVQYYCGGLDRRGAEARNTSMINTEITNGQRVYSINSEYFSRTATGQKKIGIISLEGLSYLSDKSEIEKLRDIVQSFSRSIKIIAYIRRQDEMAVSHKQQGSRCGQAVDVYGRDLSPLPDPNDPRVRMRLEYDKIIGLWGDVFGDENVIVKIYEMDKLKNNDIIADYMSVVGIDQIPLKITEKNRNTSLSWEWQMFLQLMIQDESYGEVEQLCLRAANVLSEDGEKAKPSKSEAINFYEEYRESNKRLNRRFGVSELKSVFRESFDSLPEHPAKKFTQDQLIDYLKKVLEFQLQESSIHAVLQYRIRNKTAKYYHYVLYLIINSTILFRRSMQKISFSR